MQVLLRTNVARVGRRGEVVTVKDGYARNYLLPRGMAVAVKSGDLKGVEAERRRLAKIAERERLEMEQLKDKLSSGSVTIIARANEEGHLFGSVGAQAVADALSEELAPVEASAVRLEAPIKELGVYDVAIHLGPEVEALTKVWVVGE